MKNRITLRYIFTVFGFTLLSQIFLLKLLYLHRSLFSDVVSVPSRCSNNTDTNRKGQNDTRTITITWHVPPIFLTARPDVMFCGFSKCMFSNCKMSFVHTDASTSDAVIFTGRQIPKQLSFTRPTGQVWIFYEHEPPYRYSEINNMWNQSDTFNWTMTYDGSIADIHLPYGKIDVKSEGNDTDVNEIMKKKTKIALIVLSHCETPAERIKYLKELKKYLDVDVLGECGEEWSCGKKYVHDDCFDLINSYKFFLAFENSFCNNYFTEKIYDNFDYDSVLVVRGGLQGQSKRILPEGTFISADDFKSPKELGEYLSSMSDVEYETIIKRKRQYTSLHSYNTVFQNAMCEVCYRMNNLNIFKQTIADMNHWAFSFEPCRKPNDLETYD